VGKKWLFSRPEKCFRQRDGTIPNQNDLPGLSSTKNHLQKNSVMRILCFLLFVAVSFHASAWGATGHRATGRVAEKYLSKKARKNLKRVLGQESIAMASTWMDEIRSDSAYDHTADWHWVTIQDGQTYEQSEKNPNGDVVMALERLIKELKAGGLDAAKEREYVKMVIHLVGDIHQPLHVGGGTDRGGNDVRVRWFRTESNLHRVWDSDMIDGAKLSYTELADWLGAPERQQVKTWQAASVRDWAAESVGFRKQVYAMADTNLGYLYAYRNMDTVKLRLLQAGVRLAGVLNEIYR
jgi:hypothetical protein